MNKTRNIVTRVAEISIDSDFIILIKMIETVDVDEFDILDLNLIIRHFSENKPCLKLIDSRNKWTISPKAKRRALSEFQNNKTLARAIVVSNTIKKGVFSFMKKFESKDYPQEYFTDIEEAKKWLLNFKK